MTGHAIRQGFIEAVSFEPNFKIWHDWNAWERGQSVSRNGIGRGCCVQRRVNSFFCHGTIKKKTQRSFGDLPRRSFFIRDSETLKVFDQTVIDFGCQEGNCSSGVCERAVCGEAVEEPITICQQEAARTEGGRAAGMVVIDRMLLCAQTWLLEEVKVKKEAWFTALQRQRHQSQLEGQPGLRIFQDCQGHIINRETVSSKTSRG